MRTDPTPCTHPLRSGPSLLDLKYGRSRVRMSPEPGTAGAESSASARGGVRQHTSPLQLLGSLQHHSGVWCVPEALAAAQKWPERLLLAKSPLPLSALEAAHAKVAPARSEAALLPALRAAVEEAVGTGAGAAEESAGKGEALGLARRWRGQSPLPTDAAAARRYGALAATVFGPASMETAAGHCLVAETALGEGKAEDACDAADKAVEALSRNRATGPEAKTAVWLLHGRAMEAYGRRFHAGSSYRAVRAAWPCSTL